MKKKLLISVDSEKECKKLVLPVIAVLQGRQLYGLPYSLFSYPSVVCFSDMQQHHRLNSLISFTEEIYSLLFRGTYSSRNGLQHTVKTLNVQYISSGGGWIGKKK